MYCANQKADFVSKSVQIKEIINTKNQIILDLFFLIFSAKDNIQSKNQAIIDHFHRKFETVFPIPLKSLSNHLNLR